MAFALFGAANIGHNCSIDYRQVMGFCLKGHHEWSSVIWCEKSNTIFWHIFWQCMTKFLCLAHNYWAAPVQESCLCIYQTDLNMNFSIFWSICSIIYSPHQQSCWVKENWAIYILIYFSLPSTIHWQRIFWTFGEGIWARRTSSPSSPSPDFFRLMFEMKQACDQQTGQNCSIYLQSEPSGGERARATAHAALLLLLSLSPAASRTGQTAWKRQEWYLFVCSLLAEGVEMSRPSMGAFWVALPGSHQAGRNDPGN